MKYITRKQKIIIGLVGLFGVAIWASVILYPTNNPLAGLLLWATLAIGAVPFMVVGSIHNGKNRQELATTPQNKQAEVLSRQAGASLRRKHSILLGFTFAIGLILTISMISLMDRSARGVVMVGEGDWILIVPPALLLMAILAVCEIVISCTKKPRYLVPTGISVGVFLMTLVTFIIVMAGKA